jgi:predicted SAM-dependent methyltransferase
MSTTVRDTPNYQFTDLELSEIETVLRRIDEELLTQPPPLILFQSNGTTISSSSQEKSFFDSESVPLDELNRILNLIDENLGLRKTLHEWPDGPSMVAISSHDHIPVFTDDVPAKLKTLRELRAPRFSPWGNVWHQIARFILNLPIRIFGRVQAEFNQQVLELLTKLFDQSQSHRYQYEQYTQTAHLVNSLHREQENLHRTLTESIQQISAVLTPLSANQKHTEMLLSEGLQQIRQEQKALKRAVSQETDSRYREQQNLSQALTESTQQINAALTSLYASQNQTETILSTGQEKIRQEQKTLQNSVNQEIHSIREKLSSLQHQSSKVKTEIAETVRQQLNKQKSEQENYQQSISKKVSHLELISNGYKLQSEEIKRLTFDQQSLKSMTEKQNMQILELSEQIGLFDVDVASTKDRIHHLNLEQALLQGKFQRYSELPDRFAALEKLYQDLVIDVSGFQAKISERLAEDLAQIADIQIQINKQSIDIQGLEQWLQLVAKNQHGQHDWVTILERKLMGIAMEIRETITVPAQTELTLAATRIIAPTDYEQKITSMKGQIKINLGCGEKPLPGYINIDFRDLPGVDMIADVRQLPYDKNSLSEIYSAHLVEHFREYHFRTRIIPSWKSLLKPSGTLRIICPDWQAMLERLQTGQLSLPDFKLITFGAQDYSGDDHFSMYTPESLVNLLKECGFSRVEVLAKDRLNGICPEMELVAQR